MATGVKYYEFKEDLGKKVHDLDADVLKIALTNTAPNVSTHAVLGDITEISAGNGYSAGGSVVASNAYSQTAGVGKLTGTDVLFTASGGAIAQFRYAVLYNDTPASPLNPLICYWDYGSAVDVLTGETFNTDFGATIVEVD